MKAIAQYIIVDDDEIMGQGDTPRAAWDDARNVWFRDVTLSVDIDRVNQEIDWHNELFPHDRRQHITAEEVWQSKTRHWQCYEIAQAIAA
jgi:hypothetical protein